jgi:hypothetical protein
MHMEQLIEQTLRDNGITRALIVVNVPEAVVDFYLPLPVTTFLAARLEDSRTFGVVFKIHVLPWWKTFGKGRFIWKEI